MQPCFALRGKDSFPTWNWKMFQGLCLLFAGGGGASVFHAKSQKWLMIPSQKAGQVNTRGTFYSYGILLWIVRPFFEALLAWWRSAVWQDGVLIWKSHPAICDLLRFEINLRILVGKSQALGPQTRVFAKEEEDSSEALMDFYGLPLSKRFLQQVGITRNHTSG